MSTTTLRAELLKNLDVALNRDYVVYTNYDRNETLVTTSEHLKKFDSEKGYFGPYRTPVRAGLLDLPLYLGDA